MTDPRREQPKTYLVQVDGEIDEAALAALRAGVVFKDGPTCGPGFADRRARVAVAGVPSVRFRQSIPTSWLKLRLRGGATGRSGG